MRRARLDLTRYGHFTDAAVVLPHSECDLHLIVGENEAGKSTIRQAILDLFYGIAKSSPYGFKHGLPDMELAGVVEDGQTSLAFRRLKKNKSAISRIENHAEDIKLSTIERVALALGKKLLIEFN